MELARPPLGAVRRLADLPAERQPSEARELGERRSDAPEFSSQTRVPCKGQGMHEKNPKCRTGIFRLPRRLPCSFFF